MYISVLSRYLIKTYLEKLLLVLLVITGALILSNIFDLLHRVRGIHLQFDIFIQLVFLKIPYLIIELLPLVTMLATFMMHFALTKRNELFVLWTSGISIYKFLIPVVLINFLIAIIAITILNPISTYMLVKYEDLESKFTDKKTASLTLSNLGIMILEHYNSERRIYVAESVSVEKRTMDNVSIFFIDSDNNFLYRIEANKAHFGDNKIFMDGVTYFEQHEAQKYEKYQIDSNLKIENLVEGVTPPDHLNFWNLPEAISKLSYAGFPTFKHQLYYSKLLFKPIIVVAYILLSMCFISKETRPKNRMHYISIGIFTGLVVYLLSQICTNIMAYDGSSVMWAVCVPVISVILFSNFALIHWRKD